jgi:hypothetical protein
MRKFRFAFNILVIAAFSLAISSVAQAQATRTWVSGVGDDANPCSRTAPCKTFAGAISKTAAGGEISVLDPGGFGALTITKSITINGDGTLAGVLASLTNGFIVNCPLATDKVVIRNVSINGAGNGINGIRFLAGGQLNVQNCSISGFTGNGIEITKTTSGIVSIKDTTITQCTTGINATTSAGFVVALVDNVRLENMSNGVIAGNNTQVTLRNSSVFQNNTSGLQASTGTSTINTENCMVANNGTGINASAAGATIRLSRAAILNNTTGINIAGGAFVVTFQNNVIAGNAGGVLPNTPLVQQ